MRVGGGRRANGRRRGMRGGPLARKWVCGGGHLLPEQKSTGRALGRASSGPTRAVRCAADAGGCGRGRSGYDSITSARTRGASADASASSPAAWSALTAWTEPLRPQARRVGARKGFGVRGSQAYQHLQPMLCPTRTMVAAGGAEASAPRIADTCRAV